MGAERVDGGVTDKVAQEEGRCKSRAFIPSRMAVSDGVGDSLRIGTAFRIVSRRKQAVYEPKEAWIVIDVVRMKAAGSRLLHQ